MANEDINDLPDHLTLSQIAKLAGVKPSAVSNWRRRGLGFPLPVRTEGREERFATGEVLAWLERRPERRTPRQKAQRSAENAPSDLTVSFEMALCALVTLLDDESRERLLSLADDDLPRAAHRSALKLQGKDRVPRGALSPLTTNDSGELVARLVEVQRRVPDEAQPHPVLRPDDREPWLARDLRRRPLDPAAAFEAIDAWRREPHAPDLRRYRTPRAVAQLMAALLPPESDSVYDPAAGEAHLLLACAQELPAATVAGTEIDEDAWATGVQRLIVHGIAGSIRHGDALDAETPDASRYSAVVCDPPFGTKLHRRGEVTSRFRRAASASPEMQWLLHCLDHLAPGGTAVVTQPISSLFREGPDAEVRRQLVGEGWLKAVLTLPSNLDFTPTPPTAVLLLEHRPVNVRATDVLFADLSTTATELPGRVTTPHEDEWARIVEDIRRWRANPTSFRSREQQTTLVPILDVLRNEAPLSPRYWIDTQARLAAREDWVSEYSVALDRLDDTLVRVAVREQPANAPEWTMAEPPPLVPLQTFVDAGSVDLIRGTAVDKSDFTAAGHPVLTAASFPDDTTGVAPELRVDRYVAEPLPNVSRAGDVVMLPRGRAVRATVDEHGGHSVAAPLMILRTSDHSMLRPQLLAELVTSPRIQALAAGNAIKSVSPKTLTLPRLDPHTAAAAADYLDFLNDAQAEARAVLDAIESVRLALITGLEAGAKAERPE